MNLTHRSGGPAHQSRTWRDVRSQPAPCLPTHRYSCPMTVGHPQPDHDGGRRYGQHRRLEPLKDYNCGMARVAHHAAFRWQPGRARRCTLCSRSPARWQSSRSPAGWQKSPLLVTARSGETSSIPAEFIEPRSPAIERIIPNAGECDETPPYVCGSRSDAITTLANPCDIDSTGRREWGVRMRGSYHRPLGRQGRP